MARHPLPAALAWTDTHPQPLKREFSVRFALAEFSVVNLCPEKAFNTARLSRNQKWQALRFSIRC